jgi:hypothetical protein
MRHGARMRPLPVILTELTDTLKGKLVTLDENTDGVAHELLGNLKNVVGHGSGQEDDLGLGGKKLEDVVDRVLETGREHLVGLVKAEHLDGVGLEGTTVDHVEDTAGGSNDDLGALVELGNVLTDGGTTDTSVAVDVKVVTKSDNDLLDLLSELTGGGQDKSLGLLDVRVDLQCQHNSFVTSHSRALRVQLYSQYSLSGEWRRRKWRSCRYRTEPGR